MPVLLLISEGEGWGLWTHKSTFPRHVSRKTSWDICLSTQRGHFTVSHLEVSTSNAEGHTLINQIKPIGFKKQQWQSHSPRLHPQILFKHITNRLRNEEQQPLWTCLTLTTMSNRILMIIMAFRLSSLQVGEVRENVKSLWTACINHDTVIEQHYFQRGQVRFVGPGRYDRNWKGSIVSSYRLCHWHSEVNEEAESDAWTLTVVSELYAGWKSQLCSVGWNILRPDETDSNHEERRRIQRGEEG